MVVEVSKKYLPQLAVGFNHPKVEVVIGDGFEYLKGHLDEFDVIITDSSDPVGKHLLGQNKKDDLIPVLQALRSPCSSASFTSS